MIDLTIIFLRVMRILRFRRVPWDFNSIYRFSVGFFVFPLCFLRFVGFNRDSVRFRPSLVDFMCSRKNSKDLCRIPIYSLQKIRQSVNQGYLIFTMILPAISQKKKLLGLHQCFSYFRDFYRIIFYLKNFRFNYYVNSSTFWGSCKKKPWINK